jgi:hypothetical protein
MRLIDGERILSLMYWDLIPCWAKDTQIGYKMFYARDLSRIDSHQELTYATFARLPFSLAHTQGCMEQLQCFSVRNLATDTYVNFTSSRPSMVNYQ